MKFLKPQHLISSENGEAGAAVMPRIPRLALEVRTGAVRLGSAGFSAIPLGCYGTAILNKEPLARGNSEEAWPGNGRAAGVTGGPGRPGQMLGRLQPHPFGWYSLCYRLVTSTHLPADRAVRSPCDSAAMEAGSLLLPNWLDLSANKGFQRASDLEKLPAPVAVTGTQNTLPNRRKERRTNVGNKTRMI
ncbi:hypothetical protein SKAU_G00104880 [Synaphobranchus kaupii]|uniref:Uncharacterized protein n=1 Tax=Synaphobranchus kaupii TaxID=118154 RepID=A0A9Q1FZA8_SYNKA|nr:hypothetical protein SKAU_G00104880 [Synaphobranchus kaupii]